MPQLQLFGQRGVDLPRDALDFLGLGVLQLLDQHHFVFVDGDGKVLLPVGEKALDDLDDGGVLPLVHADKVNDALGLAAEVHFARFDIDVPGQDVVQDDLLDKCHLIVFFII